MTATFWTAAPREYTTQSRRRRVEVLRLLTGNRLISQEVIDNLLSWRRSGFSLHGGVKVPDRRPRLVSVAT